MGRRLRLEAASTLSISILLIIASIYFLSNSLQLMQLDEPRVAASLLAAVIGLAMLSASVTLLRTWVIARVYEEARREEEGEGEIV
ncbi:MAG: hypothetical protein GSR86_07485 [Desulfurococcales archaeon]|nr:hypothetical protein [Desulfurococcales archaeon]